MASGTVLIADDDSAIRTVLTQALTRAGFTVRATGMAAALWRWVSEGEGDVVVTDVVLPDENAFDVLPRIRKMRPTLPVVVMSAQNTIMTAIRSAELGAYDYLPKPFDLTALVQTVARALDQSAKAAKPAPSVQGEPLPIIGRSSAMQDIYRLIARLTQTDLTVTIVGESGTGKELVARALHDFSKRKKGPFVALNMAAIPRELIESELFGHEKGAFTGAAQRSAGRFEQAEGGTLFLDEIGEIDAAIQIKLLRFLGERTFERVGSSKTLSADVRLVAATNKNLEDLVKAGTFREDLFFRLRVVEINLPPLRERAGDIPLLARAFLKEFAEENSKPIAEFTTDALDALIVHRWPGNVRELRTAIEHAVVLARGEKISLRDLPPSVRNSAGTTPEPQQLLAKGEITVKEAEKQLLIRALKETDGNRTLAAKRIGMSRRTLHRKLDEYRARDASIAF